MIKRIFERTKDSVINFRADIIHNLGYLITVCIMLLSFFREVILYIEFIVKGGYTEQIRTIMKNGGFDGFDKKITSDASVMIYSDVAGKIILSLVCIDVLIMMICYFRTSGKAKKIIMIVDLVLLAIQIVFTIVVFWIAVANVIIRKQNADELLKSLEGTSIHLSIVAISYIVLTIVSISTFLVLILITKDSRRIIGNLALALAVSYIGFPLVLYLLENAIPLLIKIVKLILVICIFFVLINMVRAAGSGGGKESSSSGSNSGGRTRAAAGNLSKKGEKKRQMKQRVVEENCAYIPYYNKFLGFKLWKIHGWMHDYIASDNGAATREICSLEEFEKGEFHIYESESGREIKSNEIPWMKQM